jgi:AbrB family looped-hinge helix DNA binding protein
MNTYVTVKGQIVIPAKLRKKLGIKKGTRIQVDVDEETQKIILTPITREFIQGMRGRYRGKGLLKALEEEKKNERNFHR